MHAADGLVVDGKGKTGDSNSKFELFKGGIQNKTKRKV
jgi:hypothetical protein